MYVRDLPLTEGKSILLGRNTTFINFTRKLNILILNFKEVHYAGWGKTWKPVKEAKSVNMVL